MNFSPVSQKNRKHRCVGIEIFEDLFLLRQKLAMQPIGLFERRLFDAESGNADAP